MNQVKMTNHKNTHEANIKKDARMKQKIKVESPLLTPEQASQYLNIAIGTLSNWRGRGDGPKYVKFSNQIRYKLEELQNFIDLSTRGKSAYEKKVG